MMDCFFAFKALLDYRFDLDKHACFFKNLIVLIDVQLLHYV